MYNQHSLLSTIKDACQSGRDPLSGIDAEVIGQIIKQTEPSVGIKILIPELFFSQERYRLKTHATLRTQGEPSASVSELIVKDASSDAFVMSVTCSGVDGSDRLWARWVSKSLPDRKCRFLCDHVLNLSDCPSMDKLGEVRNTLRDILERNKI